MIWTYSKRRARPRPSRIEETGFQKNYYSVRAEDGSYNDGIDEMLEEVENKAAKPYQLLLHGEIPETQDRADFALFLATCYSRSPVLIRSFAEMKARTAQLQMRIHAQTRERFDGIADAMERDTGEVVGNRDSLFAFINDPSRYYLGVSEKSGLQAISLADELAPLFYERHWVIAEAVNERFITSDNPVGLWVPREGDRPFDGNGHFKNPRAQVSFPLSSAKMLIITGVPWRTSSIFLDATDAWNMNRMRASQAEDLLFADKKDDRIWALSQEFRNERPRMSIGHEYARNIEIKVTR